MMVTEQCKSHGIILSFKPEQHRFPVTGNIYKFEQVILNLIKNSIDALEEKKQVREFPFEMKILVKSFYDNDLITITVEDTGIGIGEKNIESFPFLTAPKNVILYHHEHHDGTGFFGKAGDEIPLMSRILSFADELDFNFNLTNSSIENQELIKTFVQQTAGILHNADISETFMTLSTKTSFWLDMQEITLNQSLADYIPNISINVSWQDVFKITEVFSKIIDAKSKFTFRHTSGLIEKVELMAKYYNFDEEKVIKLKIAASLHDLGKLAVPNTILEKNDALTSDEFETIKIHTYFTHFTLRNLEGFHEIERWAYCHHEKLDGSGYPYGFKADELGFEERLMACLDIYQALTEDRPYRAGMSHEETLKIMDSMAEKKLIDADITKDISSVFF